MSGGSRGWRGAGGRGASAGSGAGPQAPGSGAPGLGLRHLALTWSLFLQNVAACFPLLLSETSFVE